MLKPWLALGGAGLLLVGLVSSTASAIAPSFQGLGDLPGGEFASQATKVSADGSVVVGGSTTEAGTEAFRWTAATGAVSLGDLPGGSVWSGAADVSTDGSVVVGRGVTGDIISGPGGFDAFRWSEATGMVGLANFPGVHINQSAFATSADGNIVVGRGRAAGGTRALRWTESTGLVALGVLPGGDRSEAFDISDDGTVIIGRSRVNLRNQAVRWTDEAGIEPLIDQPGELPLSDALAISGDGKVIFGLMNVPFEQSQMFRWTEEEGVVGLGFIDDGVSTAIVNDATFDGSQAVGVVVGGIGPRTAFLWDAKHGVRDLREMLLSQHGLGAQLAGWELIEATGISADGRVIAGNGVNPNGDREAWVVNLVPEPSLVALIGILGLLAPVRCSSRGRL